MIVKIQSKKILTKAQAERLYVELKKKRLQEGKKTETALDILQLILDAIGLVPAYGEVADGVNALISVARDDWLGALLSSISLIPVVGDAIGKGGKLARYIVKLKPFIEMFRRSGKVGKLGKTLNITGVATSALIKLQRAITRHGPEIKRLLVAIKSGDLKGFEEVTNITVPKFIRDDFEKALKDAGPKMNLDAQYKFINFMSNLDPNQPITEEKKMKITKSKLRQIIREELKEAHPGGGAGASSRRELAKFADWQNRRREKAKCQSLEAEHKAGGREALSLAQKIRCAWAAKLGGLAQGEPEEPLEESSENLPVDE